MAPLPLPLRNRLAELILAAFDPGEARATLLALSRGADADGGTLDADDAGRLLALGWFEPAAPRGARLRAAHRVHGPALADRARRALAAVRRCRSGDADGLRPLLDRASALANEGLYFEVHELLEPAWFGAPEPARTALQGLIQIAVAFHHLEAGNRGGARSLLVLGVSKVAEAGTALPLETRVWLDDLRATLATLAAGGPPGAPPRWPRP